MSYSISSSKDSCYPGTTILVNKLGLKSQEALDQAEKIAVTLHSVEIEKEYNGLPLSFNYYCSIHKRLFGDIYEWAGSLRTVEIAKKGTKFCKPEDIFQIREAMFLRLQKNSYFKYLPRGDRRKFCVNDGIRQYKESWQSQEYHKDIYDKGVRKPCSQPHRNY